MCYRFEFLLNDLHKRVRAFGGYGEACYNQLTNSLLIMFDVADRATAAATLHFVCANSLTIHRYFYKEGRVSIEVS